MFILGENLALKKTSLQSGGSDGDQTSFAPTLAVDGGKMLSKNLKYFATDFSVAMSGEMMFRK